MLEENRPFFNYILIKMSKQSGFFFQIFVTFSEYLNFIRNSTFDAVSTFTLLARNLTGHVIFEFEASYGPKIFLYFSTNQKSQMHE